jgi:hypothetical protein
MMICGGDLPAPMMPNKIHQRSATHYTAASSGSG